MRTIVLHYHLFKNAGTSMDRILQNNFCEKWVTTEFPTSTGNNTEQVAAWIADTPDAIAFSSHTMLGPIPRVHGVTIIPVMLLRDPIARIHSAYRFERDQTIETWGTQLARAHDFDGYVRARLAQQQDRQCRNFQTSRLASMTPVEGCERERAIASAHQLQRDGVLGRVENFAEALDRLNTRLRIAFPEFHAKAVRANATTKTNTSHANDALMALLTEVNKDDLAVLDAL